MTVDELKKKWLLSKVNPILFYLPYGDNTGSFSIRVYDQYNNIVTGCISSIRIQNRDVLETADDAYVLVKNDESGTMLYYEPYTKQYYLTQDEMYTEYRKHRSNPNENLLGFYILNR